MTECIMCGNDKDESDGKFSEHDEFCCNGCFETENVVECEKCSRYMRHEEAITMNEPDLCGVCRDDYAGCG